MATPSSQAGMSDFEPPSSPVHLDKSFMTNASAHYTEDEDNTTRMSRYADTPDPADRYTTHGGSRSRGARDSASGGAHGGGGGGGGGSGGGSGLFKDPSAIGKIRHLKKEDGEPLWRSDIQYDFLRAVFDDERQVFTNSYEKDRIGKQCFADLYIDTMARSSKTSKILHDKLLSDRNAAKSMAMVCLLVNIGRMNTTLNFFPEMRAQLRTYHAIPALQAHQDTHAYKQLQDAPRLKSILKGGSEDRPEPRNLEHLKERDVPRTNPVNLIFLICHSAAKVAELHFPPGREFHDLIMKTNLSSKSRANAFLWIMWFYLESDFTEEGCEENPFGAGVDYGVDVANQGVPVLDELTPEEEALENRDSPEEREFGLAKKNLRSAILREEQLTTDSPPVKRSSRASTRPSVGGAGAGAGSGAGARDGSGARDAAGAGTDGERAGPPAILPRIRPSKHDSDVDSNRSTPPPRSLGRSFGGAGVGGVGGGSAPRRAGPLKYQIVDGSSPVRQPPLLQQLHQQQQQQQSRKKRKQQQKHDRMQDHGDDDDMDAGANTPAAAPSRKPRPPTAHQIAVENNRKQRIEYLLSRGMQRKHHRARKTRRLEGAVIRSLRRLEQVENPFEDSESEDNISWNRGIFSFQPGSAHTKTTGDAFRERGFAGLVLLDDEPDDFGEEISAYASAMRRACRRANRWEQLHNYAVVPPVKRPRAHVPEDEFRDPNETEDELDFDGEQDVSVLEPAAAPTPAAKRRRTAAAGTPSRAKGGKAAAKGAGAGTAARSSAAASTSTSSRRRRPAPKASSAKEGSALGDAEEGDDGDKDATTVASGGEAEAEAEAGTEAGAEAEADGDADGDAATPAATKLRVKAKKGGDDVDDGHDDDELNDVDKTLLGMGDGDSDTD